MVKETYYSLTLNGSGTAASLFCAIQPDPSITFLQGGFTFAPTASAVTSVTIYPQVAQLQIPPSSVIAGGVTIVTSETTIAGGVTVSPPSNVPLTLTLYGIGGEQIGAKTLEAGATSMHFSFEVSPAQADTLPHSTTFLNKILGR